MDIVALSAINGRMIDLVGGKAAGLGALIKAGENVPAGFCITTNVFRRGELPRTAVVDAYQHLGGGPVAVRSSATAEDTPDASFAGQHETVLDVSGEDELITAIRTCWQSLGTPRAIAYREARWRVDEPAAMAVVVQRMVEPAAGGVAFTANPITGTRTEIVIDAVAGLGRNVADGSVAADHYVVSDGQPMTAGGSLSAEQLEELRRTGRRVERSLGRPQDLEWAFDRNGKLWLLQARPITTIFPVPSDARKDDLRVYLETGHMQGIRRPITPMGMSVLTSAADRWLEAFGFGTSRGYVLAIAGRMFLDITGMVRDRRLRARLPQMLGIYGPGVAHAVDRLLKDPRLATRSGRAIDYTTVARIVVRVAPGLVVGAVRSLINPTAARRRAFLEAGGVAAATPPQPATAVDRIQAAAVAQDVVLGGPMTRMLPPLYAGLLSSRIAAAVLGPVAGPGEVDATQRGMPYNVTTQMDLELWRVAVAAMPHRTVFLESSPEELADRFHRDDLPEIGLRDFLARYGHRCAAEIDVGVPRWAEDPTPIFAALVGYLRLEDPEQAPDHRFTRAAIEAEETLHRLIGRAMRTRPFRAAVAGFLLRRSRELAGLRGVAQVRLAVSVAGDPSPASAGRCRTRRPGTAAASRRHHVPNLGRGRGRSRRIGPTRVGGYAPSRAPTRDQTNTGPRVAAVRRDHAGEPSRRHAASGRELSRRDACRGRRRHREGSDRPRAGDGAHRARGHSRRRDHRSGMEPVVPYGRRSGHRARVADGARTDRRPRVRDSRCDLRTRRHQPTARRSEDHRRRQFRDRATRDV